MEKWGWKRFELVFVRSQQEKLRNKVRSTIKFSKSVKYNASYDVRRKMVKTKSKNQNTNDIIQVAMKNTQARNNT